MVLTAAHQHRHGNAMNNEMKTSTWNVRTLGNARAKPDLNTILQDYGLDIMTIPEIRGKRDTQIASNFLDIRSLNVSSTKPL